MASSILAVTASSTSGGAEVPVSRPITTRTDSPARRQAS